MRQPREPRGRNRTDYNKQTATRAAGAGPRAAGIDRKCESAQEADDPFLT